IMKLPLLIFLGVLEGLYTPTYGIRVKRNSTDKGFLKDQRISGGEAATEGFAPYQISLQGPLGVHNCGGAIISDEWVLTAAHCVDGADIQILVVVTGTNKYTQPGSRHFIESIHIHCNYDSPDMHNDIALLHLQEPIEWNGLTQPIPLPLVPMKPGDDVILTGWGLTVVWGIPPIYLRVLYVKYVPHLECKVLLNNDSALDVGHICTFSRIGEGTCHGDSGGPLISNGYLVGLVNWGYPCATGVPDAHASVYYYRDWIRSVMSGNTKCGGYSTSEW
ncbi:hypothetical protein KR026_012667, partial [Drosophila bipectinata]